MLHENQGDQWATASLRIASETMTINDISAVMRLRPSKSWYKGELSSVRNPQSKVRTHNIWILDSNLDSTEPLTDHLSMLLADIEPRRGQLHWLSNQCTFDLLLGYSPGSVPGEVTLSHTLIQRLANLSITLVWDLISPTNEGGTPGDAVASAVDTIDDHHKSTIKLPYKWASGELVIKSAALTTLTLGSMLEVDASLPTRIEQQTNESPYRRLYKGESVSAWSIGTRLLQSARLEEHFTALLDMVEAQTDAFTRVAAQASIALTLLFASEWGQGSLILDGQAMKRLALLPVNLSLQLTRPPALS